MKVNLCSTYNIFPMTDHSKKSYSRRVTELHTIDMTDTKIRYSENGNNLVKGKQLDFMERSDSDFLSGKHCH